MVAVRGVLGLILAFLGRELNFVFAAGFAAMIALRVLPLLPASWPSWGPMAFVITMALIAALIPFINERTGYVVSGFLAGGFFLADYFVPNFISIPILPFIFGGAVGGIIMGVLTEWALMAVSSLVGAIYAMDMFTLQPSLKLMLTGGLFLAGALTQVVMRRMQQK
ncbi:MAG TPA: hypothetical protein VN653_19775 [Anaerolineales bacterium]|nr:hypothetical protein [Anaerolineales bacterium]